MCFGPCVVGPMSTLPLSSTQGFKSVVTGEVRLLLRLRYGCSDVGAIGAAVLAYCDPAIVHNVV